MKEEKIRLTAPMFCKLAPHVDKFQILNNTVLTGKSALVDGFGSQALVLDDLVLYLVEGNTMIQMT